MPTPISVRQRRSNTWRTLPTPPGDGDHLAGVEAVNRPCAAADMAAFRASDASSLRAKRKAAGDQLHRRSLERSLSHWGVGSK